MEELSHTLHEADAPEGEVHGRSLQRGLAVMPLRTHLHGRAGKTQAQESYKCTLSCDHMLPMG